VERTCSTETESVCPVCLKKVKARRLFEDDNVFLVKECENHGIFKTIIWRGEPAMREWQRPKEHIHPEICYSSVKEGCPFDCGLCKAHEQLPCSVLLEVTNRCNLYCAVCFADSGGGVTTEEPSLEKIEGLLQRAIEAAGPCNLQLSGGEPTLRDDLPAIVEIARRVGYTFIQVNTNGLRLTSDEGFAEQLSAAGLSSVFLQFDGVHEEVYRALRGRALFEQKLQAIRRCGKAGLGVILVPTLVKGINTDGIGDLVRQALQLVPVVRGVHFQPVSYFGRFPAHNGDSGRFTLPELMRSLETQTAGLIKVRDFSPPGTEHAYCSFHATYMYSEDGSLRRLGAGREGSCCSAGVGGTIDAVSRRWKLPLAAHLPDSAQSSQNVACGNASAPVVVRAEVPLDLDVFLNEVVTRTFTISAMAFQDAENLDLERLRGCCISIVSPDGNLIPFCAYNLTSRAGHSLYRRNGSPSA
jgi:7,8-dihydro-6-hydroxymethylpterin dimethyltransferase